MKAGTYILSDSNTGDFSNTCFLQLVNETETTAIAQCATSHEVEFTLASDQTVILRLFYKEAVTFDYTYKPMIRYAADTDSTWVPYALTNQQLTPIAQSVSNPNLLDNPWFTVNQRGFTSGTVDGKYFVDRWFFSATDANITVTKSTSGININGTVSSEENLMCQKFEYDRLLCSAGDDYTLSVMFSDGTVKYKTDKIKEFASNWSYHISFDVDSLRFMFCSYGANPTEMGVWVKCPNPASLNKTIKAIKLEKGCVSTLAMDTVPNYATELLKCQRYFYKTKSVQDETRYRTGHQCIAINTNALSGTAFPITMRTTPTVTVLHCHHMMGTTDISGTTAPIRLSDGVSYFMNTDNPFTIGAVYALDFEASADL